jgi:hypothetical protein
LRVCPPHFDVDVRQRAFAAIFVDMAGGDIAA